MFGAVVVLWLGSRAGLGAHDADIAAWSAARGLSAAPPAAAEVSRHDPQLADQIEVLLEEGRTAPTSETVASAFEAAERLLLAHPELPQAAWLMAERYASEALAIASRGDEASNADRDLLERARQLEGPRAPALGSAPLAGDSRFDEKPPSRASVMLVGIRPLDIVLVDGVLTAERALEPGRHHVQLVRGARRVWVGWVDATSPSSELGDPAQISAAAELQLQDPTRPCSELDLADVTDGPEAPRVAAGVTCRRWVVARPSTRGGTEIAECAASRCGGWQHTSATALGFEARVNVPPAGAERGAWPSWAAWGLIGAGGAVATGIILWQTGVFERSEASTEFVFTGPSAAAYHF